MLVFNKMALTVKLDIVILSVWHCFSDELYHFCQIQVTVIYADILCILLTLLECFFQFVNISKNINIVNRLRI